MKSIHNFISQIPTLSALFASICNVGTPSVDFLQNYYVHLLTIKASILFPGQQPVRACGALHTKARSERALKVKHQSYQPTKTVPWIIHLCGLIIYIYITTQTTKQYTCTWIKLEQFRSAAGSDCHDTGTSFQVSRIPGKAFRKGLLQWDFFWQKTCFIKEWNLGRNDPAQFPPQDRKFCKNAHRSNEKSKIYAKC